MKHIGRIALVSTLIVSFLVVTTSSAFAYLDPGTGSYILQVLVVAFTAIAISIKAFWYRIKMYLWGRTKEEPSGPEEEE